ncbi:MAG: VWA domain-containing protein [Vicinamibacterales bacterium]
MCTHWLLFGLTLAALLHQAQAAPPVQRFKTSVDVVQVDVSAIDGNGQPVLGLTAADFELRVDGRPRSISSVQFVSVPPTVELQRTSSTAAVLPYASNAEAAGGRLIMVVVDRSSIATGRGKAAIEAASRFVGQLNRADRVALASIPNGPQVTFTADHALVQRRIREIDGTAVADIGEHNLGIVDAMAFERKNDAAMEAIYERECGTPAVGAGGRGGGQGEVRICQNTVRSEANVVAADARERARTSIQGLEALLDSLPPSHTPKMLVLITEGLVVDRELSQLSWLEAKAAAAHVTIYTLMLDRSQTDASQRRPEAQPAANRAMRQQGLDFIAQATRGDVFQVMSNSDFAFRRLALELSGYYLLGFEPEDRDRGGTAHTIAVTVKRRGVTVRSRRQFRIDPGASKTLDSQVVAALRDPLPAAEIPIKLATFSFRDPIHDKLRLLIGADIDRSVNPDGHLSAGYVVVDFDGKLAASQMDTLQPPAHAQAIQHYFSTVAVDAGRYTVKLVVVDDAGRRGSVEMLADAHLTATGPLQATDLLIADAAGKAATLPLAPVVGGDITGHTLYAYMELFAEAADALGQASVTLEVASALDPATVVERVPLELRVSQDSARFRIASGRVNIARTPPGDYVARAVVAVGLEAVGEVRRPFRIVRAAEAKQ